MSTNCQFCGFFVVFELLYRYCPQVMDTVVPGAFIVRVLAPSSALNMEDLPTFGLPTNTTRFTFSTFPILPESPPMPSFAGLLTRQTRCRQQPFCERQQSPPLRFRRFNIRAYSRSLRVTQRRLAHVHPARTVPGRHARCRRPPRHVRFRMRRPFRRKRSAA